MKKKYTIILLALALVILSILPLAAQQALQLRLDSVNSDDFPAVQVAFTVRDADGVPVYGLTADNFEINEDRQPQAQPIDSLSTIANPDIEVSVMLALDISGSMSGTPLADAKTAAIRFLDRLEPADRAALIAFADGISLAENSLDPAREIDFSNDKTPLITLIDSLNADGATPLYDAAFKAVSLSAKEPIGNRAVLLLTDGRDEDGAGGSGSAVANAESAIREANRANVPVFVIALGKDIDRAYLKRLALETGGTYQETPNSAELSALFQNVADLLKQQYVIRYQSALPADGLEHRVSVSVDLADRTATDEMAFGPLPLLIPPTDTPLPKPTATPIPATATSVPTLAPTDTVAPPVVATPNAPIPATTSTPWGIIGGGLLALAVLGGWLLSRRGKAQNAEYCRNCGYRLTAPGACPQCGDTHRVPKPKL